MAPSRRSQGQAQSKAQTRAQDRVAAVRSAAGARSKRNAPAPDNHRDVYQDMITEATSPDSPAERPLKKPRLGRPQQTQSSNNISTSDRTNKSAPSLPSSDVPDEAPRLQQTVIDSEESDEDDLDWEQVGLDHVEPQPSASAKDGDFGDVSLEISTRKDQRRAAVRRKPATTAEKLLRLEAHEAHLLCLLFHVHVVNAWCNLAAVQAKLKTILPPEVVSLLHPDQSLIQFGRSEQFVNGLKKAVLFWRARFNITASGLRRSNWAETPEDIVEQIKSIQEEIPEVSKEDFIRSAANLSGSQDLGNQLFCALLRCVGVEARLVCSLQPLPFGTTASKAVTPQKGKATIYAEDEKSMGSAGEGSAGSASEGSSTSGRKIIAPGRIRRMGQSGMKAGPSSGRPTPVPKKKRPIRKLDYPIFWVEAFNAAYQKWIPVDAIVTGTVAKPSKLEPPASYNAITLTYVVAFEDNSIARDVTRRYAKAYNAKTRKLRVESTENGEKWWRKALKVFRRPAYLDRDQVEDAELAKKEAAEGLPNNVQDFKDHPYYALERHLKRHEVVWPKREVGKINAEKTSSAVESVFRRSDVQIVRSADKWYRFGREIKPGEQPLKHVPARSQRGRAQDLDDVDMDEQPATALYAFSQTALYVPPPVVRGRIPKNAYGNLDVYVPSMVPPGACHIRHSLAQKAARLVGVDYADAVTGFQFKGRHGTAVTSGVVVANDYREAIEAVIESFEYAQENEDARIHSLECLRLWKRFMAGLRIKERLTEYTTGSSTDVKSEAVKAKMDEAEDEQEETMEAGGFFPNTDEPVAVPTSGRFSVHQEPDDDDDVAEEAPRARRQSKLTVESDPENDPESNPEDEDEFVPSPRKPPVRRRRLLQESPPPVEEDSFNPGNYEGGGGFLPEEDGNRAKDAEGFLPDADANDYSGGFVPGDDSHDADESGGGFIPEITDAQDDDFGGGFIPEDRQSDIQPTAQTVSREAPRETANQDGGFLPEVEIGDDADDTFDPDEMDTAADVMDPPMQATSTEPDNSVARKSDQSAQEDDEEDERGSLLSHDPDDEDAEPEWLNSD